MGVNQNICDPIIDFWNPSQGYPKNPKMGDRYIAKWGEYDRYYGKWDYDYIYEWTGKSWQRQKPRFQDLVYIKDKESLYMYTTRYSCNNYWNLFLSFKDTQILTYVFKIGILENRNFLRNISDEIEKGFKNED